MKTLPARLAETTKRLLSLYHPKTIREKGLLWATGLVAGTYIVALTVLSVWWGWEPDPFNVNENAQEYAAELGVEVVTGFTTAATVIHAGETLLTKPGGYLSNDVTPPGLLMDNIPNWEFGVLVQIRDMLRSLRNDMSRSQSQSIEDKNLAFAEPQFNFQNDSWMFPSTESEYTDGLAALKRYTSRLADANQQDAQFFARADNLRDWLAVLEKRLGSLSQRLSASVGQIRINTDLAGDAGAAQSTSGPEEINVKTPWLDVDDVFYEARGTTWALVHFLRAVEHDFDAVLRKKNALPSLRQIIRELEATQETVWSPLVLNGGGFGIVTNYSLVMANYISRANAAVIDLRNLLEQG